MRYTDTLTMQTKQVEQQIKNGSRIDFRVGAVLQSDVERQDFVQKHDAQATNRITCFGMFSVHTVMRRSSCMRAHKGQSLFSSPLARRTNTSLLVVASLGNLKSRARARFDDLWIRNPGHELTLIEALEILLRVWNELGQGEILDA
jgi:hypothetical protein